MEKHLIWIIFSIVFYSFFLESCDNSSSEEVLFPEPPDTTNLITLANFLSDEEVEDIIDDTLSLGKGKMRHKGFIAVPQDGDDFRKAVLDESFWEKVHVVGGDFRGASFRSSKCRESDFSNSNFRVADMRWTDLDWSDLSNCDFRQAKMFHVYTNDSNMENSDFRGANMFGMEGHRANLRNCDFSNALMKDTEFINGDFTGSKGLKVRFIRAVLQWATIDSVDFSYSDFTGAGLEGTTFKNSRLLGTNFQGSHLQEASFEGANLEGCNFFAAEMDSTIFKNAVNIPKPVKKMMKNGVVTGVIAK